MYKTLDELKTWADLREHFSMVLFNNCTSLNDNAVLNEWLENHTCESQEAMHHIDTCETKNCKKCKEYITDYGESPQCECEPYQWFAIDISEFDVKKLNKYYDMDIFYSDTLDMYILPVYHFGTSWHIMKLGGGYELNN